MEQTLTATAPSVDQSVEYQWLQPGQWTYDDYLQLPDDGKRYEIINGVLYMANAPSYDHQFTVSKLDRLVGGYVEQHKLGVVLVAPFEIHLSDIAKPVQPDVFFIAAERQPSAGDKLFEGVPEVIIEVISTSSVRTDRVIKFAAYELAGVREYWLVDPRLRFVEVYSLSADVQEYVLVGQFGKGEQIHSIVLPDFVLEVDSIFVPLPI
jgi:Uma2 family endonuclease